MFGIFELLQFIGFEWMIFNSEGQSGVFLGMYTKEEALERAEVRLAHMKTYHNLIEGCNGRLVVSSIGGKVPSHFRREYGRKK